MAATLKAFTRGLHEEHLQEISLLFEQQQAVRQKPAFAWPDAADIESRIEAHLDALVIGGATALEVCLHAVREGDFGELYGATVVFCRQQQAPMLAEVLRSMDFKNAKKQHALVMALRKALPGTWGGFVEQALVKGDGRLIPSLAAVSGHLRLPHGAALMAAWQRGGDHALPIAEALGRLRETSAEQLLVGALSHQDTSVRDAAALALWRMGRGQLDMGATPMSGALAAGPAMAVALHPKVEAGQAGAEEVLALGVLGYVPSWPVLYRALSHEPLAEAAATALQWSTGANLQSEVFVAEEVDEQALFKHELQAWQQYKQAPRRADGQPFGETVTQPVTDPSAWQQWFTANANRFDSRLRYRDGQPCSPAVLVASLKSLRGDIRLRRCTALELEIRYGCPVPFEVDMEVQEQVAALRTMEAWSQAAGTAFEAGRWYLNGTALPS
ncbi:MAG: HEAT repeat domain-containing protein [Rhizobacter sp.]